MMFKKENRERERELETRQDIRSSFLHLDDV
jgi:hypothetical protein